jgi:hypothetical protein
MIGVQQRRRITPSNKMGSGRKTRRSRLENPCKVALFSLFLIDICSIFRKIIVKNRANKTVMKSHLKRRMDTYLAELSCGSSVEYQGYSTADSRPSDDCPGTTIVKARIPAHSKPRILDLVVVCHTIGIAIYTKPVSARKTIIATSAPVPDFDNVNEEVIPVQDM